MTRSLAPGPCAALCALIILEGLVEEQGRPGCIHFFDHHVVAMQQLPGRSHRPARLTADLRIADDAVGVRNEGDIVAQIIPRPVLGSMDTLVGGEEGNGSLLTLSECGYH
jgi:hypothetical protein